MKYRHEWKHSINYLDVLILRQRLGAVMSKDSNAKNDKYHIRSIYFDTPIDSALREKIDGISKREKFRIRYYNKDTSFIKLEKKSKNNNLCNKQSCIISSEDVDKILKGNIDWMRSSHEDLIRELYYKMRVKGLRPKTIVDYIREPYVYSPGNVRVTIDYNIRTGIKNTDFLNPNSLTIPTGEDNIILEVKWDEFLPETIRAAVALPGRHATAFSKYAQCRIYG